MTRIKLKDLPENGYLHTNDPAAGEICLKGGGIMTNYFKNPEKTAEAFTEDGWLMTGDVAKVFSNGQIQIIDRAKNIFKLSQGEYISPEKVENIIVQSDYILQAFVHGDSLCDYTVLIGVVDPEAVKKWAKVEKPTEDHCRDPEFMTAV